ncbi:hypothetical protein CH302_27735 [Rhodococcus sp. 15-2388-1-1a]|uniref:ASCH domain-containing protein n=1 Tax=Rhodococcus sp. 15-2388-1-1a TaxID=2023142 RepID=UPI000B9C1EF0|nr:ASCH domain-containing protein [Rhodococcus sp. 15-2388-1-1a]OZE90241.1 hypothetical protein CH302_27735 [Rhodococcus sp. 15-2388-1-1a]
MKALTVQQPWAWAIMHGGKTIENRTQNWKYRGPLAIHAGARWSDRGAVSEVVDDAWAKHGGGRVRWDRLGFPMGAIVGVVDLVDVHPESGCCTPWGESAYVEHGGRERRRIVHLVLENPRPLPAPYPCSGALGLWTPPQDIVDHLVTESAGIG